MKFYLSFIEALSGFSQFSCSFIRHYSLVLIELEDVALYSRIELQAEWGEACSQVLGKSNQSISE